MRSVTRLRAVIRPLARRLPGLTVSAETAFHYEGYLRLNQRRLEHLASLRLPIGGKTVLEVGAGVGDHTSFFIDRSCIVTATDGRASNIAILQKRYPTVRSFTRLRVDSDRDTYRLVIELVVDEDGNERRRRRWERTIPRDLQ